MSAFMERSIAEIVAETSALRAVVEILLADTLARGPSDKAEEMKRMLREVSKIDKIAVASTREDEAFLDSLTDAAKASVRSIVDRAENYAKSW